MASGRKKSAFKTAPAPAGTQGSTAAAAPAAPVDPISEITREYITGRVAEFREMLQTHVGKIPFTGARLNQEVLDPTSLSPSGNMAAKGIDSRSIQSQSPLSLATSAVNIAVAADLCRESVNPLTGELVSLLELGRRGDIAALLAMRVQPADAEALIAAVSEIQGSSPEAVSGAKQVFFEAGGQSVLVTPLYPVKFATELNKRLTGRAEEVLGRDRPEYRGHLSWLSVGGANPRNASILVNGNSVTTSHGRIPLLRVWVPKRYRGGSNLLRVALAKGGIVGVLSLERDDLIAFGKRAAIDLNLSSHLKAEAAQAAAIAESVVDVLTLLNEGIAALPADIWNDKNGWGRFSKIEQRILDARTGEIGNDAAAEHLAGIIAANIRRIMSREEEGFSLSARSFSSLERAIREELNARYRKLEA